MQESKKYNWGHRKIGINLYSTGQRAYKLDSKGGKHIVSWIIKKCNKCQRFLSKYSRGSYCSKCGNRVRAKEWRERNARI